MQERRHVLRVSRTERPLQETVISLSAKKLENLSKVVNECMLWVATMGDRISEFEVFKHQCANRCCLLESTTMGGFTALYVDKGYMTKKSWNVARNIDAWIQKELRDSPYRGCTVAYKDNVYNIYMKPRGNKMDAMLLSGDSEVWGCRPRPNL